MKETLARIEGTKGTKNPQKFAGQLVLQNDRVVDCDLPLWFMRKWHRHAVRDYVRKMRWTIEVIHEMERRP